jgi:hypothetical protein
MSVKADSIETETINFPYLVSPSVGVSNLGNVVKRPRVFKTGGITPSTLITTITIGQKGVYSITTNIQARLLSSVVPQMYWNNPSIGNIGFGKLLGDGALIRFCELNSTYIINNTAGIFSQTVTVIIPASQTGLLDQLVLDYMYIRIA